MTSLINLDERQRRIATERADLLRQYQTLRSNGLPAREAQKEIGISAATYSRWNKAFTHEGLAGLADRTSERRGGASIMKDDHRRFLYATALTQHQPKLLTIYRDEYMEFCASLEDRPVSYATFLREYRNIPETVKTLYRKGSKAFADSNPFHIRDWNQVKPMDVIFSDHVELNFFAYRNGKMVRPWVTWWMDGHSRKGLSWIVTTKPNQDTISLSLLHTIKQYGTPNQAYVDNGKDYKSKSFMGVNAEGKRASKMEIILDETMIRGIFQSLHIEPIFATPYNAKAKPIEPAHNFIHNLARKIEYGYAGANVLDRPEYMKSGVKVMGQKKIFDQSRILRWEDVNVVVDLMFEKYNAHDHRGLNQQLNASGMTPDTVFEKGFNQEVMSTWESMVDERDLTLLMMRVAGRTYKVHSNGVYFHKNYYFNDHLLINNMEGQRVIIRYDPGEVNEVGEPDKLYIYDSKDRFVCGAPMLGKNHPTEADAEEFAKVAERKKIRREVTRQHYEEVTRLMPEVNLESMSFSSQSKGVN